MPLRKLTKKKPIINSALQGKPKHMIKLPNPLKYKDKLEHKWKNKAFSLINEQIKSQKQECILTVRCGNKDEMKQLYLFSDSQEGGLPESWQQI